MELTTRAVRDTDPVQFLQWETVREPRRQAPSHNLCSRPEAAALASPKGRETEEDG